MDARAQNGLGETAVDTPAGSLLPQIFRFTMSPLNKRRWANFKVNKRGYWSLWLFLALFVISLFAEFIANDKPIMIHVNGHFYFPAVVTYPDTAFSKKPDPNLFGTAADYKDDYLMGLIRQEGGTVIWAPIRYSYNTRVDNPPSPFPSKPTWMLTKKDCDYAATHGFGKCGHLEYNWLGTDDGGRDVLARLIYGFRISVLFGLCLTIVSSIIGVAAGAVQGYFGGWTDLLFQRFIEIWTSIPSLYLLLIISSVLVPGFFVLLGILLLFSWVSLVGLVRAEFLRGRNFEYIQAARALGVSNPVIIFRHLLPNAMAPVLVAATLGVAGAILTESGLSFLGLGVQPPDASWGNILNQGKANIEIAWWLSLYPGLAILVTVLGYNLLGEGIRDALDPRLR